MIKYPCCIFDEVPTDILSYHNFYINTGTPCLSNGEVEFEVGYTTNNSKYSY